MLEEGIGSVRLRQLREARAAARLDLPYGAARERSIAETRRMLEEQS
jgi:hypothetical protein